MSQVDFKPMGLYTGRGLFSTLDGISRTLLGAAQADNLAIFLHFPHLFRCRNSVSGEMLRLYADNPGKWITLGTPIGAPIGVPFGVPVYFTD